MTRDERAWLEVARRRLAVLPPTVETPGVKAALWYVRDPSGNVQGFGASPLLAVEAALNPQELPATPPETAPSARPDSELHRELFGALGTVSGAELVRAWAVAGILYERHQVSAITDAEYDALSARLLDEFDFLEINGDWLTEGDLSAGTAMGYSAYPSDFHALASAYLKG